MTELLAVVGTTSAKATTQTGWRVVTAARVFALATALGLTLTTGQLVALAPAFLALCALAALMSLPVQRSMLRTAGPVVEGVLTGLLLAAAGETATPLLVYLLIPPFAAGVQAGVWGAVLAITGEGCASAAVLVVRDQGTGLTEMLERSAPWMVVGMGLGLLGAWIRASANRVLSEQQRYKSAHRLLGQLHAVARDLPHGLDAPSLGQRTLSHSIASLNVGRAMLLLRDKSGTLVELALQGPEQFAEPLQDDPRVAACLGTRKTQQCLFPGNPEPVRHRVVLPLRVETRTVGVIVVDTAAPLTRRALRTVQARLDGQSLRLESAMLFDQVRSMATVEERHRLAREIHDGIAQEIASLGYLVDDLAASSKAEEANEAAYRLRGELTRIVNELRFSIFDLRMDISQHGGLGQALSDYARDIGARANLTVHTALAETGRLPIDVQTELLRIAQEAITNVRKHAGANNLWVSLNTNGTVAVLRVEDDGAGSAVPRNDHYGLQMMRERADRIGAELAITNRPRGGASVVVALQPSNATIPGAHRADLSPAR
jgi:signal transduction histidine kinase